MASGGGDLAAARDALNEPEPQHQRSSFVCAGRTIRFVRTGPSSAIRREDTTGPSPDLMKFVSYGILRWRMA